MTAADRWSRAGMSLLEMIVVLVLAGIIGTAALTLFSSQNRLNSAMTSLGEAQENARSAVATFATELRPVAHGGVVSATSGRMILRVPLSLGIVCDVQGDHVSIYLVDGHQIEDEEVDGVALRGSDATWTYTAVSGGIAAYHTATDAMQRCAAAGAETTGVSADYSSYHVPGMQSGAADFGPVQPGQVLQFFQQREYEIGTSDLDGDRRALKRDGIDLAQGLARTARFEYRVDGAWRSSATGADLDDVTAIRFTADVVSDGAASGEPSFSLVREIPLRNVDAG